MHQTKFEQILEQLNASPKTWLVTGVAGFIGSNLLETLLRYNQRVLGLDNFSTGHQHNLDDVHRCVTPEQWRRFEFHRGDIRNLADCRMAVAGVDYVLHQAALGSVPRSIEDPIASNESNVTGFLNMLVASRDARVASFTYAASSSTYGDHPDLPKVEDKIGRPLSPYAVTKYVNELYASVFSRTYGFSSIGLRYFNVFGPRQDPNGAYAAVIPKWIMQMKNDGRVTINGDGETSRDFCYVENAIEANILAATTEQTNGYEVLNVAVGQQTTLNQLALIMHGLLEELRDSPAKLEKIFYPFRSGDIKHSLADISKSKALLKYSAKVDVSEGLKKTIDWYNSRQPSQS